MSPHTARLTPLAFTPLPLPALEEEARLMLKSARLWASVACTHRSPRALLAGMMGPSAATFALLMETLVAAWPDPFLFHPPCACAVSPDEQQLLHLLTEASHNRLDGFHAVLADLLPAPTRERLWAAAQKLHGCRLGRA